MEYELPISNPIEIEYEGHTVTITDIKDIRMIENILLNSKYQGEICEEANTYKITFNHEVYYIKEFCKEIQKGNQQAKMTDLDFNAIKSIVDNKVEQ